MNAADAVVPALLVVVEAGEAGITDEALATRLGCTTRQVENVRWWLCGRPHSGQRGGQGDTPMAERVADATPLRVRATSEGRKRADRLPAWHRHAVWALWLLRRDAGAVSVPEPALVDALRDELGRLSPR